MTDEVKSLLEVKAKPEKYLSYAKIQVNEEISNKWAEVFQFRRKVKEMSEEDIDPEYRKRGFKNMMKKMKLAHKESFERTRYLESIEENIKEYVLKY